MDIIFHNVLINVDMTTNYLYLTWCNAVDGYWMVGDPDTNTGGIASATTGDEIPPSQWQYYYNDSWNTDDATLIIESQ